MLLALSGYFHFFKIAGVSSALILQFLFSTKVFRNCLNYFVNTKVIFFLLSSYIAINLFQALESDFSLIGSLLISMRRIIPIFFIAIVPPIFKKMLTIKKYYFNKNNNLKIQFFIQIFFLIAGLISILIPCVSFYFGKCFLALNMPSHISYLCINAFLVLIYLNRNLHYELGNISKNNLSGFILYFISILNIFAYLFLGIQSGARSFGFVLILSFMIYILLMLVNLIKGKKVKNIFNRLTKPKLYFYTSISIITFAVIYFLNFEFKVFDLSLGVTGRLIPSILNPNATIGNSERWLNWGIFSVLNSNDINTLLFGNGIGSKLNDWNTFSIYDSFYNLIIVDYGIIGLSITLFLILITFLKIRNILCIENLDNFSKINFNNEDINNKILAISFLFLNTMIYSFVNEVLFINGGVNMFTSSLLLIAIV